MPLVRRCCIVGCTSNSKDDPNQQFFQFPKPETTTVHRLWKQQCHASLAQILPFKKPVMCSHHFSPQCIGTRRLISTAVPTLRLDIAADPESFQREPTLEEIEYKRKYAYINAVVFEWMVRSTLSGEPVSITNGMVKKKASQAAQLIRCTGFEPDGTWLSFFRKNFLDDFAQKLATNQLQMTGIAVLIPKIVKDFKPFFPPPNAGPSEDQQQPSDDEQEAEDDEDDQSEKSQQLQQKQRRKTHQPTTGRDSFNQSVTYDCDEPGTEHRMQRSTPRLAAQKTQQRAQSLQNLSPKRRKFQAENTPNRLDDFVDGESEKSRHGNGPDDNEDSSSSAATGTTTKTTVADDSEPSSAPSCKELHSYAQAVAYLRPLEEFVLFKENFRAIGLIAQLENILLKGERITSHYTNTKK